MKLPGEIFLWQRKVLIGLTLIAISQEKWEKLVEHVKTMLMRDEWGINNQPIEFSNSSIVKDWKQLSFDCFYSLSIVGF